MSTYITSDLHGDMVNFKKLLQAISFDMDNDYMYILGDVLDRGISGLELFMYIQKYVNNNAMTLIKGNHELFAQMYIENKLDGKLWNRWGGTETRLKIDKMNASRREQVHKLLSGLPHFKLIDNVSGHTIVLTHSGIHADYLIEDTDGIDLPLSISRAINENEFEYLISNDLFYIPGGTIKKFKQYLIVGHVPVIFNRDNNNSYKIVKNDKYMCVDTGSGYRTQGGRMSAYRLEDGREFYI